MTKDSKKKNLKSSIMNKVRNEEIKMKAKWKFAAKKIGLKSGFALTVLVLIFLINSFFYFIKSNNLLMPLHYGESVAQKFLHSLPYDLILIIILLFVALNFILKKFDISYKKPFALLIGVILLFITIWSLILFSTNFNDLLKSGLKRTRMPVPYVKDFYINRCGCGCVECNIEDDENNENQTCPMHR